MASADYICCHTCGKKLIYDGTQDIRRALETFYGRIWAEDWTVVAVCEEHGGGIVRLGPDAARHLEDD